MGLQLLIVSEILSSIFTGIKMKWKHSIVETANIRPRLPYLMICYSQNVEKLTG